VRRQFEGRGSNQKKNPHNGREGKHKNKGAGLDTVPSFKRVSRYALRRQTREWGWWGEAKQTAQTTKEENKSKQHKKVHRSNRFWGGVKGGGCKGGWY